MLIAFLIGKLSIPAQQEFAQYSDINATRSDIHLSDRMKEAELKKWIGVIKVKFK